MQLSTLICSNMRMAHGDRSEALGLLARMVAARVQANVINYNSLLLLDCTVMGAQGGKLQP